MARDTIGLTDLPASGFRIEVSPAWSGLPAGMNRTFAAQLYERKGQRWYKLGVAVLNDDGPAEAISDLLLALTDGRLPR